MCGIIGIAFGILSFNILYEWSQSIIFKVFEFNGNVYVLNFQVVWFVFALSMTLISSYFIGKMTANRRTLIKEKISALNEHAKKLRPRNEYPAIKSRLSMGWRFGESPSSPQS